MDLHSGMLFFSKIIATSLCFTMVSALSHVNLLHMQIALCLFFDIFVIIKCCFLN